MKRILSSLAFASLLAFAATSFSGCASVTVANQGPDMVTIQNSGCFLFCCIPLFSGDPNYPNQEVCNWFENTVKVETNLRLLEDAIAEQHAWGAKNIISHPDNEYILWFILKRKIYRTSAELIKD